MWALILFLPLAWGQLTVSTFSAGATVPTYVVSNDTQIFNIQGIVWNCTTPSPPLSSFGQFTSGKLDLARLLDCLKYYNASSCLQGSTFPPSSGSTNVNLFRGTMAAPQTVAVGAGQVAESIVFNFYVNATCNSVADSKASSRDVSTGTGTGTGISTGTGTGTGTGASTGTGTGTGASTGTGTGTGTGSQSCVVVRTNLTNLNATSYSPVLPVPFIVPCANDNVVLSVWIDNPNTTKLGILATAFGGQTYYKDFITLTGTASALNGSLSGFYFMQTRVGTGDQIIKYSWAQQGFATVNNTFNLYASGLVAVSPDASSFTVTNTSEAVITTAEDPTRESATYSVKLSINPSDYTNDLAIYYISLIYRVHKKFIKIIAYSFSNNKFQTQQSGADVKFSFVGLSASQEQRAVNIAKVNCAQLSQSNAVKVDCASLSSSTSAQSNSGVTKSSSGLVAGAIVGIIIGSVALAIILALCIGYAVMKMQSAPQPHYPDKEGEPVPQYVNYAAPAEVYAPAPAAVPQIGYAPGPAPYTYA